MSLRLSVESDAWRAHVAATARAFGDVLPVVKGNGYGFGRDVLMPHAAALSRDVAVGTAHEVRGVPADLRPFVLTPIGVGVTTDPTCLATLHDRNDAVLAVGTLRDLDVLSAAGLKHAVVVKVESSMHRYGVASGDAESLRARAESAGHEVVAWSVHLPLAGNDDERAREAIGIAGDLAGDLPLHLSHVGGATATVRAAVKQRLVVRAGTQLWLGDKSMLALHADVIAVRVATSPTAGYRASSVVPGSRLVMVGCGSSHGVSALDDGHSPFHFARRRLPMVEAPHMHTTMLAVTDDPCPNPGDWVDVQQPMTRVLPDTIVWK